MLEVEGICFASCVFVSGASTLPSVNVVSNFEDKAHFSLPRVISHTRPDDKKQTALSSSGDTAMETIFSSP